MEIARVAALIAAPSATWRAAQRLADDAAAISDAVLSLARSVPTQLSAVTLRLGEIQSDVAALAGIARGVSALELEVAAVAERLASVEADTGPLGERLAAIQQSLDTLAATVDAAVALLPDPDGSPGLLARARDALGATDAS